MTEMPFGVTWCYEETDDEDEQCQVLIIEEPEEVPPLHINISNKLPDKTITINSVDGVNQADADNYHFKLAFLPGILSDPQAVGLESENWSISSVSNSDQDSIYLLWTGGETSLSPGEMIEVILTGVAAQSAVRTTTTDVTINWQFEQGGIDIINIERIPDQDDDYDDNTTLKLDMVQSTGKSNIPLYAGFVNCNKVLNTNEEASSLQLRLTNTKLPGAANADLTFNYDSDINLCSQLVITLEVGTVTDVPWALAAEDEVNNIAISIAGDQWSQNGDDLNKIEVDGVVQALQWTFIPDADVVLAARETMLINLDNIITSHPTGETNLYLGYQYVPGYKDGQFVCQIEKAPLVFDTKVRVGMRKELDGLFNVKDGISLDSPGEIQHTGPLIFRSDIDKTGDSDSVQFYQQDNTSPLMRLSKDGSLYLTDGQLKVGGRIQDLTGYVVPVGTIVPYAGDSAPQGWWICDGTDLGKDDYPELFDVIQHTYGGEGDTFKVPDLQGRVPVGKNSDTFKTLGSTGGEETHQLTKGEMPAHTHTVTDSGHSHSVYLYGNDGNNSNYHNVQRGGSDSHGSTPATKRETGITIDSTGSNYSHNNLQPYLTINYIIKA